MRGTNKITSLVKTGNVAFPRYCTYVSLNGSKWSAFEDTEGRWYYADTGKRSHSAEDAVATYEQEREATARLASFPKDFETR